MLRHLTEVFCSDFLHRLQRGKHLANYRIPNAQQLTDTIVAHLFLLREIIKPAGFGPISS